MLHYGRLNPYLQTLTRLENLAMVKHSSLLQKSVNNGQKSFITLVQSRLQNVMEGLSITFKH